MDDFSIFKSDILNKIEDITKEKIDEHLSTSKDNSILNTVRTKEKIDEEDIEILQSNE
jgi:hypothetical protein